MKIGSFCTGYGGLDIAVTRVFGGHTVWTSDIDKGACKIIEARFPHASNLGDLTTQDWAGVAAVDIITAGYPCQPFSLAGRREGLNDPRHIWPFIRDAIGHLRPRYVVLENVRGHLSLGGKEVVEGLASIGYDSEWALVRASDVGACHQRARLFIVAGTTDTSSPRWEGCADRGVQQGQPGQRGEASSTNASLLESDVSVSGEHSHADGAPRVPCSSGGGGRGGQQGGRVDVDWGRYEGAVRRHELVLGRPAPQPSDEKGRLNPVFVEWMMMLPAGWVTDVLSARTVALKALGNGVVPAQAEYAIRGLLGRP